MARECRYCGKSVTSNPLGRSSHERADRRKKMRELKLKLGTKVVAAPRPRREPSAGEVVYLDFDRARVGVRFTSLYGTPTHPVNPYLIASVVTSS